MISPLRASPLPPHCPSCPQVTLSDLYVIARFRISTFVSVLTTEMDSCSVYSFTVGSLPAAFRVIPPCCCASWWFIVQPSQSVTESQAVPLAVALGSSLVWWCYWWCLCLLWARVCVSFVCACTHARAHVRVCLSLEGQQLAHWVCAPPASIQRVARLVYSGLLAVSSL